MKENSKIVPKLSNLDDYRIAHLLSKSTFVRGKQCQKLLYLNAHKKKEAKAYSKQTQVSFAYGKKFEDVFREKFENGILIPEVLGNQFHLYAGFTEELLADNKSKNIFEAGVVYNDVLVLTDVLQQNENGSFTIYEIKNTDKIKPVVMWDLALQYYVCKNKLENLESFNVVLRGKKGKFRVSNVTDLLDKQLDKISKEVELFKTVLKLKETPKVEIGSQCFRPYECPYFDYCRKK